MKIGLVGSTYQERSLPFNAQRTVNAFPVKTKKGKEVDALYGTPGLKEFCIAGSGAIRAEFYSSNGRAFVVSGSEVYEIDVAGNATLRGTIDQTQGNVSIDENATQLGICDGQSLYIFTYEDNDFSKVSDDDLPLCGSLAVIDSYFIVNKNNSGQFYISTVADGANWAALDFASAESSPDKLLRVYNALGQLWLFGERTTEIWSNTGAASFPFERIAGAKIEAGIVAPHTVIAMDSSVFWLGRDKFGSGIVLRARGFTPIKVSTSAIDYAIQSATNLDDIRAWSYQMDGHYFYVLTGGGLKTSLVYDLTMDEWHERAYLNEEGKYEQHLASSHMLAFDKHLVGDRNSGKIYEMSMDVYSDDGNPIKRERIYTHISNEDKYIRYNNLVLGFETGVGLQSGHGSDPKVSLQMSKDGARTWSDSYTDSIGKVGEYKDKVRFRRLGIAEKMTFRISMTDPVKFAITGSYLN